MKQEKEQKISPIKQRILHFAETLGISKRNFYAQVGISRGTLESKTGITEDVVAKFIAAFPDVNVEWLITGTGEMKKQHQPPQEKEQKKVVRSELTHVIDQFAVIIAQKDEKICRLERENGALTERLRDMA